MTERDAKHFKTCDDLAAQSPDPSRKTGAVIVDAWGSEVAYGYNHLPIRIEVTEARLARPAKYKWMEHAERDAIYYAASKGIQTAGCTMYLTWYPCVDCARGIIQAQIGELVCREPDWNDPLWDFGIVKEMLEEAGVLVRFVGKFEARAV